MNHIYIRPLRTHDAEDVAAFTAAADASGRFFPKDVFTLPSTRVMVAEKREEGRVEVIAYMPQYISLVLGSLVNVTASDTELASAQHQFTAAAYTRAHSEGLADILLFSNTELTKSFASRHGYEETHDGYRLEVR